MRARDPWWPFGTPNSQASVRLLCLPFAGGGASSYREWRRVSVAAAAPFLLDVCPIQPPGREARIRETPFRRLEPMTEQLTQIVRPHLHSPYALFGYSMGALVAFDLTQRLAEERLPLPCALFVAAARSPNRKQQPDPKHVLSEPEFIQSLREIKGTPEAVLAHEELMQVLLPTLRADFELCETYEHRERPLLACDILAFGGTDDPDVPLEDLDAWGELTTGAFGSIFFPGDHFFLESQGDEMLRHIVRVLAKKV